MTLTQIRLQLAIRTAYEHTILGGSSLAMRITLKAFQDLKDDSELTPALIVLGMLVRHHNFAPKLSTENSSFLAGVVFLMHEMDFTFFPNMNMVSDTMIKAVLDSAVLIGTAATDKSEEMILLLMYGAEIFKADTAWVDMLRNGVKSQAVVRNQASVKRVQTGRESMAFPHASSSVH